MQINAFGGKSGQVTEDYMLSGTCIYSFFPVFFSFALSLRAYGHVCERVFVRISTLVYVLHASFEQVINVYGRIRTHATYVPACMCIGTPIYVQFEAGHETFTKSI